MPENPDPQRLLDMPFAKLMELLVDRLQEIRESREAFRPAPGPGLDDLVLLGVALLRIGDLVDEAQRRRGRKEATR